MTKESTPRGEAGPGVGDGGETLARSLECFERAAGQEQLVMAGCLADLVEGMRDALCTLLERH